MDPVQAKIIENILEKDVRPHLFEHGGDVKLADIRDGAAYVTLTGRCSGCPSAMYTLETIIKEEILKKTDIVSDVRLHQEVSDELIAFARSLMNKR